MLPFLLTLTLLAQTAVAPPPLPMTLEPLGDKEEGVVARITFRFAAPGEGPPGAPLVVQGSLLREGKVVRNFRLATEPQRSELTTVQTLPVGDVEIEARLMLPLEDGAPLILAKSTQQFTVAKTGRAYVADENDGAEAVVAEGVVPETVGAVKILAPRRDVAPHLFIVEVDAQPPVRRVEFWVEGKKILARNAPPYRAELDLGKLPKRVEVRAIGYDAQGRYVDADAFVVNERETPLEVKITRTSTPDGITHLKVSLQNPKNSVIRSVELFAGDKKLHAWLYPPYALDLPTAKLAGVDFVRASAIDESGYEATDLLFLSGQRFMEEINVDVVELPVSVTDAAGLPITSLKQPSFTVLENGKPQKISSFQFASHLPLSLGVLIDHSGSMEKRIKPTKEAAVAFFKSIIKSGDRAFIGGFAFDPTKTAPFVSDVNALEAQVNAVPDALGGTALYDAIVTGLYRFRTVQGRKALVILTDGEDTTSRLGYDDMLSYARASRVPLYFIGIGLGIMDVAGTSKMKALAAESGGVTYFIKDVAQLDETYAQLEKELRSQYLISYQTESSRQDQAYRTIEVKVDHPDARVRTIRGYIP
jgi:VWFA-related protein